MLNISPQKETKAAPKSAKKGVLKSPKRKYPPKPRAKQIRKSEIMEICDNLKAFEKYLIESSLTEVKTKPFWICHTGYAKSLQLCMMHPDFSTMAQAVMSDFRHLYAKNHKGAAKYDNLQLDWFQNSKKYLRK